MKCDNCQAELTPTSTKCDKCGALILQNVEGFDHTKEIEKKLKEMLEKHGKRIVLNNLKFVALLNDWIPEYDQERSLLKSMIEANVVKNMIKEETPDMAIMKAKSYMLHKLFLSENAVEFVVVCFAYMLNAPYVSPKKTKDEDEIKKEEDEAKEQERFKTKNIMEKVFTKSNALKYKIFKNVDVPEGFTMIDDFCFDKYGIKTVKLPDTVLKIGEYAFSECKNLKGVTLPDSLRIIKQGAFSDCTKLTVINIPQGVLEIEDNTFQFCKELEKVEIPDSVGSIGASAFLGCEKLKKLFLPDSIKFIDDDAFSYCPELTIRCYANSYVHKYCLNNGIDVETVSTGTDLKTKNIRED